MHSNLKMRFIARGIATFAVPAIAQAAVRSSSDKWSSWSKSGYTLYNEVWGRGAGPQTSGNGRIEGLGLDFEVFGIRNTGVNCVMNSMSMGN